MLGANVQPAWVSKPMKSDVWTFDCLENFISFLFLYGNVGVGDYGLLILLSGGIGTGHSSFVGSTIIGTGAKQEQ